ncbi:MAG TPA: DivIVA domain-containing protein [Acidimicrobiales bacterium]|nr:DivIVA domain-containing protein [Acidimicrobiales bacterium]
MDLTPQTLRDVEFREKLRGYHPDDVDDFLEEVAVALEGLLARLRTAEAAAGGAPAPVAAAALQQPSDPTLSEGTLSRAILLAQRTADLAVAEAEESARQILDDARAEADRILADTQSKVAAMTDEARSAAESSVAELDQRRAALEREVAQLQSWATKQRDGLREVLSEQLRSLDVWLTSTSVPRPPVRAPRPSMSVGEPTVAVPTVDASEAKGDDDAADTGAESAPDDGETTVVRRRGVPDSPGAGVAEAVEAGSLASPGGGGDGVALFDQETEPEGSSPIGARYRRR